MGSKKLLITSILFVIVAVGVITSFSYAFFSANLSVENVLNLASVFNNSGAPVFTAYTDSDIVMNITTASMLESESGTAADSSITNMTAELTGGSKENGTSVTCLYDIYFEMASDGYDTYVPSGRVNENNLKEYTLKITNGDVITLEETQISKLTSGSHIVRDESITSSGDKVQKIYQITSTIYNLGVEQNIYNKKYKMIVKIDNPRCSGDTNE